MRALPIGIIPDAFQEYGWSKADAISVAMGSSGAIVFGRKKGWRTLRQTRCSGGFDSSGGRRRPAKRIDWPNVSVSLVAAAMSA